MSQEDGKTGRLDDGSKQVIGACIEVHRHLGPGLLESAYEHCLAHELSLRGLQFERQRPIPIVYKGVRLDCGYRLDIVLGELLIIEIKAVERLLAIHQAQLLTYLKLTGIPAALLVNFNAITLKTGLRRLTRKRDLLLPSFPPSCSSSALAKPAR
jgi:GxxExxY protein